jgi:hypothetical protein
MTPARHFTGLRQDWIQPLDKIEAERMKNYIILLAIRLRIVLSTEKYARFGYIFEVKMTRVLKRKDFARWQASEKSNLDHKPI